MAKQVSFGKAGMEKMMIGLNTCADAVSATIGPKGRNAYIMNDYTPEITNDGVKIANKIVLENPEEDAGAWIIRNVSGQQNDDVGDGTTTVTVLTQALIQECLKRPENAMEIKESLKEAGDKVLAILKAKSVALKPEEVSRVALISSESQQLSTLITEIIDKLGEKAVINVEDSKTFATDYEIVEGYNAAVGFMSPAFITDKRKGQAIYEDIHVLVTQRKISNLIDIVPLINKLAESKIGNLVLVCEDIDDSILGQLVMNKNMGTFNSLVLRCGGEIIEDIAGATGATIVSDNTGISFKNMGLEHLGKVKKVVSEKDKTLFITEPEVSQKYAETLEGIAETEVNQLVKKRYDQRIARVKGGIAQLRIGAPTDEERGYLKDKAEDAIKATKAALEEGIVEGGGMTLWRIASELQPTTIGEEILKRGLKAPLQRIVENAGKDYTEVVRNLSSSDNGYNAKTGEYVNLLTEGIIDPSKVTRCALENAVSAAATFITTYSVITEIPEKK